MLTSLIIRDESLSGETLAEMTVDFPSEQITVNELIRSRVYQEVRESNARTAAHPQEPLELVPPTATELALNGPRTSGPTPVHWQAQFEKALDAFRARQIMILVDGRQVTSLDEQLQLHPDTRICFLRLTMLMGG